MVHEVPQVQQYRLHPLVQVIQVGQSLLSFPSVHPCLVLLLSQECRCDPESPCLLCLQDLRDTPLSLQPHVTFLPLHPNFSFVSLVPLLSPFANVSFDSPGAWEANRSGVSLRTLVSFWSRSSRMPVIAG